MTRASRRGFSLVELLVVIAVILLLMGIGVIAFQHIEKVAGEKSTTTRLEMCASLLNEFDVSAGGLSAIEGPSPAIFAKGASIGSPGPVTEGSSERTYFVTGTPHDVQNTGMVLNTFAQIPSLKLMLAQLPAAAMLTSSTGGPYWDANLTSSSGQVALPVILDGWKNPIIYVPSGGLTGVYLGGPPPNAAYISTDPNVHKYTVLSVDGRPFWASAGADGNFSAGDDNIYSCPIRYLATPPP